MKYKCVFPNCTYETDNRSLIEYHHIYPRELGVKLNKNVTIPLCSCHHKMIYHPQATSGQHSIKTEQSMIVDGVYQTNTGKAVVFKDMQGSSYTTYMDDRIPVDYTIHTIAWDAIHGIVQSAENSEDEYIVRELDKYGYFDLGSVVYYKETMKPVAIDLLLKYLEKYMLQVKSEYSNLIEKGRADWKSLKQLKT